MGLRNKSMAKLEEETRNKVADLLLENPTPIDIREAWGNELHDWLDRGMYRHYARLNILEELFKHNNFSAMLDVGCGSGALLEHFASKGVKCVGFDVSRSMMNYHKDRQGFPGFVASVKDIPLAENQFDMLTCLGLIEHLEDPVSALKEMNRVVRPGGRCIITVPRMFSAFPMLVPAWFFTGGRYRYGWKNMVGSMYTRKMLSGQLEDAGWDVQAIWPFKAGSILEWINVPFRQGVADYVEKNSLFRGIFGIMLIAVCYKKVKS